MQSPPPFQQMYPPRPKKKRWGLIGCFGCLGCCCLFTVCSGILHSLKRVAEGGDWATPTASVAPPVPTDKNPNVVDQIKVLGYRMKWHPGAGNPGGPDLAWVTVLLRNNSKFPVGVVWANVILKNKSGQELENAREEIIYFAESGERGPLPAGATWKGDAKYLGEPYVPMLDYQVQSKQPVTVEVNLIAAYPNRDTGPNGKLIDVGS
jgi:hypothetical protein